MSKTTDAKINALSDIVAREQGEAVTSALRKALKDRSNFLVGKAATWCQETLSYDLINDLHTAYERFMRNPLKTDKTCAAKRCIATALYELDYDNTDFYRSAISYQQIEPVYGGHVNTSIDVRCVSALGLMAHGNADDLFYILELLHDSEAQARIGALKAIALAQPFHAELILRQKIISGDPASEVVNEAFNRLMHVGAERSLDFVAKYLHEDDVQAQAAAWALGESKLEDALTILIEASEQTLISLDNETTFLQAIALLRSQKAIDYLLLQVEEAPSRRRCQAIKALSFYNHDTELKSKIAERIENINDKNVHNTFSETWLD